MKQKVNQSKDFWRKRINKENILKTINNKLSNALANFSYVYHFWPLRMCRVWDVRNAGNESSPKQSSRVNHAKIIIQVFFRCRRVLAFREFQCRPRLTLVRCRLSSPPRSSESRWRQEVSFWKHPRPNLRTNKERSVECETAARWDDYLNYFRKRLMAVECWPKGPFLKPTVAPLASISSRD